MCRSRQSTPADEIPSPVKRPRTTTLEFVVGDLLDEHADVLIVPFGNRTPAMSRVQFALRRATGSGLADEMERRLRELPEQTLAPGRCIVTGAHGLPVDHIVHCHLVESRVAGLRAHAALQEALEQAFDACRALGANSVALPAIGTGGYGYRVSTVARVSVTAAVASQRGYGSPGRIRFVLAGTSTLMVFLHAASDAQSAHVGLEA